MIFLIRHGATEQPLLRPPGDFRPATRAEWLLDYGLSERGQLEAQALRSRFDHAVRPDRILASPRARTIETARLALPDRPAAIDDRLHEWQIDEPLAALGDRARWLLAEGENEIIAAFTHGGFIRAVLAQLITSQDGSTFETAFHGLRRTLQIWNGSVTILGHGGTGLEIVAVNQCQAIEALAGRP